MPIVALHFLEWSFLYNLVAHPSFCERLLKTSFIAHLIPSPTLSRLRSCFLNTANMVSTSLTKSPLLLLAALSTQVTNVMAQSRCYYDRYGVRRCYRQSAWNSWVRWVVLAVIVIGFLLLFFLCRYAIMTELFTIHP